MASSYTLMFLTTLMTDDRLVADLDYSDAPCPDPDDICSITVTPFSLGLVFLSVPVL